MATILIVEDHHMSRELLHTLLGYMGHRILEAANGLEALALAHGEHPDLVISDILLPEIDGMEFVRQLRSEPAHNGIPVIFYTATYRLPEALHWGKTFEPYRVIPKPSDPYLILQTVNELLGPAGALGRPMEEPGSMITKSSFFQKSGLQMAVLMDLSYSMVAQRDPHQLLRTVSRALREILNCRNSILIIQDDKQKTNRFCCCMENEPRQSCPDELLPPAAILERVAAERTSIRWQNTSEGPATAGARSCLSPFETLLVVPIASSSRFYGWTCLIDKIDGEPFSSGDEEIAITLSTQTALAYENISLVEELQKSEEYLEELVAKRTAELEHVNRELFKIQNLRSLGVLAGGIAHDFNNALTAIINLVKLAKSKLNPEEKPYTYLEWAESSCHEAVSLTRQLLTFAKGGTPVKKASVLSELMWDTAEFTLHGSNVKCEFSFPPDLSVVEIDQCQIYQVVSNLILNAEDAMPIGGIVQVRADNVIVGENDNLPLKAGAYVRISVIDQGVGIPAKDLPHIFDPYFTTKETGNGLGLATAYSIIKKHDGHIMVQSAPGAGTTFYIYLPASGKQPEATQKQIKMPVGGGRLLIIEDRESIAKSLAELLEINGFTVDTAGDGAQGLRIYENALMKGFKYKAIIMDLTIPGGMGGKEAIKHFRKMDPDVLAIVSSGYSNDPVMSEYRTYGFNGAISKPYRIEEIMGELQS